jgi:non-ribosomal peptide synthetase component F
MGPPPEPVSRQCIDYARSAATEPPAADLDYWLTELAGVSQVLPLGDGGFAGRGLPLEVPAPAGLHDRLVSAAAASGTTLFLTIATAVAIQLSRLTGRRSVVLSVPFVNRAPVDHSVITCASSPIFLRCDVDDETPFTELAWRVTERFMAAIDHLAVPTTTLLDALVARGGWRTDQPPSVALVMEGELNRDVDGFPGLTARLGDHRFHGVAHVDLLFNVKLAPPDFSILTVYNEDRLTAGTVRSWIEDLLRLLAGIAAEPGRPPGRQ